MVTLGNCRYGVALVTKFQFFDAMWFMETFDRASKLHIFGTDTIGGNISKVVLHTFGTSCRYTCTSKKWS